jgi:hypothetical protein
MQRKIKVGILVSYDYELIKNSLPPVYEHADKIVLAVDKDNKTWAGNDLHISDDFWQWISDLDTQHKIEIYRDTFYVAGLTTRQCDTRERNMLGKFMGEGGWHIQVDADEYFTDFKDFVDFLHYLDNKKPHINCVNIQWLSLFKKTPNAFLFITGEGGGMPTATTMPNYIQYRNIEKPHSVLYHKRIIHDSWARTEDALYTKLKNWSHNADFDTEGYFHFWKAIDEKNYMFVRNLHPLNPLYWPGLEKVEGSNVQELLENIKVNGNLLDTDKKNGDFPTLKVIVKLFIPPIVFKIYKKIFRKK